MNQITNKFGQSSVFGCLWQLCQGRACTSNPCSSCMLVKARLFTLLYSENRWPCPDAFQLITFNYIQIMIFNHESISTPIFSWGIYSFSASPAATWYRKRCKAGGNLRPLSHSGFIIIIKAIRATGRLIETCKSFCDKSCG